MRKKVENCPPEMMEKRAQNKNKRPQQHDAHVPNKKLCRLFDSSHLVVYGETAESIERHSEWLQLNAAFAEESDLRPRLLATAEKRHEHLRSLTISEVLFPFLASEALLLLEFDVLFKKNIADDFSRSCQQLCNAVLQYAEDAEVAAFTRVAGVYVCVICEAVASKVWPLSCFHIVWDFCRNSLIGNLTESVLSDGEALDETVLSRHCAVCPADSAPFKLDNLYIEPGDLSFLECEPVLCLHADSGCRFVGQLRYLEYHYYNDCPFVPRIGYRSEDI
ncbi:hypothetical protein HPB52_016401 [Rhipicephalus sanguineus]|uniref:Uncharacterized protein n=1 Tax=Rhipicephalus sanguineus TaxID=34632 RepID=A0A9D4SUK0_RHISA|nr:hypothetical protein HPB52_016401 [Rhipicephalus sanguineus]